MQIYVVDIDQDRIIPLEYVNITDLEQLYRDLNDTYQDYWFEDVFDALECLIEGKGDVL